eukprot:gnl/MRDRNA2_/MRDRNA2_111040_c0_seq1.p1 gnl/MRDRNA2_/MRDRNA2_111040_c0~~gnl/MRDRNA2_/MRDRNA2_111040_c0_seq1.p1  ORF type:complete len:320 (-),score=40.43 gnl/MRDRNA2_/MRDRNA2_111040_c0_seq1:9-968(-)
MRSLDMHGYSQLEDGNVRKTLCICKSLWDSHRTLVSLGLALILYKIVLGSFSSPPVNEHVGSLSSKLQSAVTLLNVITGSMSKGVLRPDLLVHHRLHPISEGQGSWLSLNRFVNQATKRDAGYSEPATEGKTGTKGKGKRKRKVKRKGKRKSAKEERRPTSSIDDAIKQEETPQYSPERDVGLTGEPLRTCTPEGKEFCIWNNSDVDEAVRQVCVQYKALVGAEWRVGCIDAWAWAFTVYSDWEGRALMENLGGGDDFLLLCDATSAKLRDLYKAMNMPEGLRGVYPRQDVSQAAITKIDIICSSEFDRDERYRAGVIR